MKQDWAIGRAGSAQGVRVASSLAARSMILRNQDCSVIGAPRVFLDTRYVYFVISERGGGLSLGVNINPQRNCTFHCVYCEVDRSLPGREARVEAEVVGEELQRMLEYVREGRIQEIPGLEHAPDDLLRLKEVVLCGDGEPTLCPNFSDVMRQIVHTRAQIMRPNFKLVLVTNGTCLHLPEVQRGLEWFGSGDEVWIKLDAGTQRYSQRVNRSRIPWETILNNILVLGKRRPVVIQSLFPVIHGEPPPEEEIAHYVELLKDLKGKGAQIHNVQIYSAHRRGKQDGCNHLPLKDLSMIARRVRAGAGLSAEVF